MDNGKSFLCFGRERMKQSADFIIYHVDKMFPCNVFLSEDLKSIRDNNYKILVNTVNNPVKGNHIGRGYQVKYFLGIEL